MDKKIVGLAVVVLLVLVLALAVFLVFMRPETRYVCPDGSVVSDVDECPTSTTGVSTTQFVYTTFTTTKATTMATTVATTATTFACVLDSDCGVNVNSTPYCSDNYVKVDVMKPVCLNPGRSNARCAMTPTGRSHTLEVCNSISEFCLQGECIARSCVNGKLDSNEEKIDCGGVCPEPCDEFSILCNDDEDCGEMKCAKDYFCLGTNPAYTCYYRKCIENGTIHSRCVNATTTMVNDVCGIGEHCQEGRGVCLSGGSCRDCIQNQDEMKIDCGGESCQPCVTTPETYDTLHLSGSNNFRAEYLDTYGQSYLFVLVKVLKYREECTYGATIRIDYKGNQITTAKEINRYKNATIHKFTIGLLNTTTSSATIWVVETE